MAGTGKQIGVIWGVEGGDSLTGQSSGSTILQQLNSIAKQISQEKNQPTITFGVNISDTQKRIQEQLDDIAKGIKIEIGGNFGEDGKKKAEDSIKAAQNAFQRSYNKFNIADYGGKADLKKLGMLGMDAKDMSEYRKKIETMREAFRSTMETFNIKEANGVLDFSDFSGTAQDLQNVVAQYNQLVNVDVKLANMQNKNIKAIEQETLARNKLLNNISQYQEKFKDTLKNAPKEAAELKKLYEDINGGKYNNQSGVAKSNFEALQLKIRAAGGETETLLQKANRVVKEKLGFGLAASAAMMARQAIKQVIQTVIELDSAVVDLQIATGGTREETKKLVREYSDLARELGTTTTQIAQAADNWLRQGYDIEAANKLIEQSTMLSKLGQMSAAEATTGLTAVLRGYKLEAEDAAHVVDVLTAVDMAAAASAGDLMTSFQETANGARIAGLDIEKLVSYLAVLKDSTQLDSGRIGTFMKSMLARMGNIKAGLLEDPETGESLNAWALVA